ncbi:hypothetical protein DPMN_176596 [Dreissena polymorpha]|uniref:Uncharacterized protein n=1 Tax=Dreissena polymorpha TaxID=45954 RepID=A0A9D4E772_DREPO|nr:hypothetical protein DPMN_176596 [Dreissena polymorpha]
MAILLRKKISEGEDVRIKTFRLSLPSEEDHTGHPLGEEAGLSEPIDKDLIKLIG